MFAEIKIVRIYVFLLLFTLYSCSKQDPEGTYQGDIKDWVHEVLEGTLTEGGKPNGLQVILKQTPDGMLAEMTISPSGKEDIIRRGKWEVDDGKRVLRFPEGDVREYYLIKRGACFAFQSKQGITNDNGSLVLLMRNEGLSRKKAYPLRITFEDDGKAKVSGGGIAQNLLGEWKWSSGDIVVTVKLPSETGSEGTVPTESYKYFLHWAEDSPNELELEKMLILKPFFNEDRSRRQSWMSSLKFSEWPRLKQN